MLFLLSGDIQKGKSRWLDALCNELETEGISVKGVLAPGVWRERFCDEKSGMIKAAGQGRFEKLGIDNILLPGRQRIPFAHRRDLAIAEGSFNENSQSAALHLSWEIFENALEQVNAHFDNLAARIPPSAPELIVVDELGRLELVCGGGLTSVMALLDAGSPTDATHALVVVRSRLLEHARGRFGQSWGEIIVLAPDEYSRCLVRSAFNLS